MIDRKVAPLLYIQTEQFSEVLCNSQNVDFVLYGCYCDGRRQIFYVDRESVKKVANLVDISSDQVVMSHLNRNEVTMFGRCCSLSWRFGSAVFPTHFPCWWRFPLLLGQDERWRLLCGP